MYRKISRGEFRCPQWFPAEVRKLLSRIIDPNPSTRIDVAKHTENAWFKKGFKKIEAPPPPPDFENISVSDVQAAFESSGSEDDLKRDVNAATSPMKPTGCVFCFFDLLHRECSITIFFYQSVYILLMLKTLSNSLLLLVY